MVRGKKAFDRVIWAFQNVLDASLAWLFYDLRAPTDGQGAIAAHAPTTKTLQPEAEGLEGVLCPTFPETIGEDDRDEATELLEWLSMTVSGSPRVLKSDNVDPYLCRYGPLEDHSPKDLVLYQWHGFAPSAFVLKILQAAMKASGQEWFALSAASFDGKGYMILKDDGKVMTWNYTD